ncbi:MAG TPA: lipid-A-disaccharide synthase [Chitinophagaceae bacterium]|nr:lipid-A-disaccharide synthase [Chitinophagaceae bacterium]
MKYYIIAGEASGDLHGSHLIKELKKLDLSAQIRCWGGDKMKGAGGELVMHYRDIDYMGFTEVLMNISRILRNLRFCRQDILRYKPDALILIDYPGFNLRIAKWAKELGFRVIYYISPQVWAWKSSRVRTMKACIDKMFVILPFEKDYFRTRWNWDVEFVGHPLAGIIREFRQTHSTIRPELKAAENSIDNNADNIVALLPGSRISEISKKLPAMLEVSRAFPDFQFVIAEAPSIEHGYYANFIRKYPQVRTVINQTYPLLARARAAIVTSGTATLETALFDVPEVVCYKGSFLSYQIGKRLVKVKYISLINLIMDKMVVKELIQNDLTIENLTREVRELLHNETRISVMKKDFADLRKLVEAETNTSARVARSIVDYLTQ